MSIIISVKINDGVVMAADSATTFYKPNGEPGQIYEHANKIVNLSKSLPIGVMTCGSAGIGNASIETLLKDLRVMLSLGGSRALDPKTYTMEMVATEVREFMSARIGAPTFEGILILKVCGYSSGASLPEVWHVGFDGSGTYGPLCAQAQDAAGIRWDGQQEALNRLIGGMSGRIADAIVKEGILSKEQWQAAEGKLYPHTSEMLIMTAAPMQDAIELARYLVETTIGFVRFSVTSVKDVGGLPEIAAITKHEGFRWVQRKHFFPFELNREALARLEKQQ